METFLSNTLSEEDLEEDGPFGRKKLVALLTELGWVQDEATRKWKANGFSDWKKMAEVFVGEANT